ncbi:MAG: emp24/gp25L/p24 family/GOLD-domain-containing protein [Podila humilis]|nr:MAG: emp24/gp25L/p24 family/GOLD-domain-containing protein [Podila humilis]
MNSAFFSLFSCSVFRFYASSLNHYDSHQFTAHHHQLIKMSVQGHISRLLLVLATVYTLLLSTVEATSLTYNVAAHEKACFYLWADVPKKKMSFYFAVQSGGAFDIDVQVKGPGEREILNLEKERQGDYVLPAKEVGEYSFCFSNDMSTFAEKLVDFEIKLEHEKRPVQSEKDRGTGPQAQAEAMDESIFRLSNQLTRIDRLQKHFRARENRNFSTVISTDNRIFWFSLTESSMIVVMSALQVYVVQTFFSGSRRSHV